MNSLYQLFDLPPTCTDDELRRSYYHALLENHPDRNLDQIEAATVKTQQLIMAYAELKKHRSSPSTEDQSINSEHEPSINISDDEDEFTFRFLFNNDVDINDIKRRKTTFRDKWGEFQQNPSDPINALLLIHAAFRAEQHDSVNDFLLNPILIDTASLLVSLVGTDEASATLIKWAGILKNNQRGKEAIQILEDTFSTGMALPSVAEELRTLHYSWAQYIDPTTESKATPKIRIEHLRRILELGFKYDYIYKLMAEAYHDAGDNEQSRSYLQQAYELNPALSGAMRISRALGFSTSSNPSPPKTTPSSKYKYSRLEQIPSYTQLHESIERSDWDTIISFANPNDYSPRMLPKVRDILCQIAALLGSYKNQKAIEVLITLLNFSYYWDVSDAAVISLSLIGDKEVLDLLEKFKDGNSRWHPSSEVAISYLRARINSQSTLVKRELFAEYLTRAKKPLQKGILGRQGYG